MGHTTDESEDVSKEETKGRYYQEVRNKGTSSQHKSDKHFFEMLKFGSIFYFLFKI